MIGHNTPDLLTHISRGTKTSANSVRKIDSANHSPSNYLVNFPESHYQDQNKNIREGSGRLEYRILL